jgi:hypothetical protein
LLEFGDFKLELVREIDCRGKPDLCPCHGQVAYRAGDVGLLVPKRDPSFQDRRNALGSTTVLHLCAIPTSSGAALAKTMAQPSFGSLGKAA